MVGKKILFTVDANKKKCIVTYNGKTVERVYPLENPVYIIFSLFSGSVRLYK